MTTAAAVSITQSDLFTALGQFIDALGFTVSIPQSPATLPVEVIRLPVNRVPTPRHGFIALSPVSQVRLETNTDQWDPLGVVVGQLMPVRIDVQIDCYGPTSGDWANILANVLRSNYGCSWFSDNADFDIEPLYADDPRQIPLVTGEDQYAERWTFNAALQSNTVTTLPQQYAGAAGIVNLVDVTSGEI